jgi:hemerythrin-like domain-containing protein
MAENELNELAELLRELEQTLSTLKATKDRERRRLLLRKMSRLFAQIDRKHIEKK